MSNPPQPHVTIIGAGIVGISCAAFHQRQGFAVTVIDRERPGEGCSFGNAGGVVASAVEPTVHPRMLAKIPGWLLDPLGPLTIRWKYLPKVLPWMLAAGRAAMPDRVKAITAARAQLCGQAVADHQSLLDDAGSRHLLVLEDGLKVYDSEAQYRADEEERRVKRAYGYDARRLSVGELRELEPDLAPDLACGSFHGGWYHVTNPFKVVTAIATTVARNGGEIVQDEVRHIARSDGRATSLSLAAGGERRLDRLVIAAGAYSGQLAVQLGSRVPLEAERGYHLTIPDPGVSLRRAVTWVTRHGAVSPMDVGLRIAGTDEFAGLEAPPDWRRATALWQIGKRVLPGLRELDGSVSRWMGRRPGLPDTLPVIDRAPGLENAWFAFGHGHMGLTWGPTTGRLIAALVAGKPVEFDMRSYRAGRF